MSTDTIQKLIHSLEVGLFSRWLKFLPLAAAILALAVAYDLTSYRSFSAPEAMDAAQVARNVAEGRGYTTDFLRPFSIYLIQSHNQEHRAGEMTLTNVVDFAEVNGPHPDLANAPAYPTLLAGLFKVFHPDWKAQTEKPFWSGGGHFLRYKPEFQIAVMNQFLLLLAVALTFIIARLMFDNKVAWLAALLTLGTSVLWKFSVSGLSTMLLLVIFLALILSLIKLEQAGREPTQPREIILWAIAAGLLTGLGMLTRYSFGWLILPIMVFQFLFGGVRRPQLMAASGLAFALVVAPWIIRNYTVSGTCFGTAGYAMMENTKAFPGSRLLQSINPDMTAASSLRPYLLKFGQNASDLLQNDLVHLGGSWMAVLFFAGLLLGLRSPSARRLRHFTLMCLPVLLIVQAMGATWLSEQSPEINSENLLVLLTPLVVIFGVVFFLTLLEQIKFPERSLRILVVGLVSLLVCQPLVASFFPPRKSPAAWPPYYPPEIQKLAGWMQPGELVMSDIPWAMAWYGDRQCVWTTANAASDYFRINDYVKPVRALFLSLNTLDAKLISDCQQGGDDSWARFVYDVMSKQQIPRNFPLRFVPPKSLNSGLFYTDRARWLTPAGN